MSVLINMEMPTSCEKCSFHYNPGAGAGMPMCLITHSFVNSYDDYETARMSDCPLVPVPPHGDLIEREVAYDKIAEQEGGNYVDMDAVGMGLSETPVIIPEDDAWPEWRTQVLGIRQQEEE